MKWIKYSGSVSVSACEIAEMVSVILDESHGWNPRYSERILELSFWKKLKS